MAEEEVFCFEILSGDQYELQRFLKASAIWFNSLTAPPAREEFKLFLEGGYESVDKKPKNPLQGQSGKDDKRAETLEFITKQVAAFDEFLESNEVSDSLFLGASTSVGEWRNFSLDSFLDAASDGTDFKRGSYEQDWSFIYNFYQNGQTLE
eukprot:gnl/MRDRNA2_/MRDRNA2_187180_c0_seq1.p1 gnl/MRDRNA2_/MRDRNA2_187180_c0~~gnl/MRDRNA2_/MRDRNA2_187180_c0_seq1.p1  ORF type:complete len:169 (+),score=36.38 gnl/MRDRNA2_/MRDRNA2_187180_c0_seq1:57-509(+)